MPKEELPSTPAASRFARSVHLERDYSQPQSLIGYQVTAGARRVLGRIAPARYDDAAARAWTLTGPYGTGKSALALFAAHLLAPQRVPGSTEARQLLQQSAPELASGILGPGRAITNLWPVVITGSREPLSLALLRGLRDALTSIRRRRAAQLLGKVSRQLEHAARGKLPSTRELVDDFAAALDVVSTGKDPAEPAGLFLIVDELGKLLEFAAAHPTESDVYVLQALAEFAAGSPRPFLILGILHQDFAVYADRLSSRERAEWDKVRGRFEDIVFEEPADEMLRLIAQARAADSTQARRASEGHPVSTTSHPRLRVGLVSRQAETSFRALCEQAWKLDLAPPGLTKTEFVGLLCQCWPLHPLVAVILGQIFRKLAQNERSVFSFLESAEPFALQEFLREQPPTTSKRGGREVPQYTVDRLYDYLLNSVGEGLYIHTHGKRWAEIETVLARLPDASRAEVFLAKAIGLLGAIGQWRNVRATKEILRFAVPAGISSSELGRAITSLQAKSAIVYRKFNRSYALWEGSDVDLDERIRAARGRTDPSITTAALANRLLAPRPIVARRHSFETGSLRYFRVSFAAPAEVAAEVEKPLGDCDGQVLIVLPENREQAEQAHSTASSCTVSLLRTTRNAN
jgi:hypothetical protein